MLEIHIHSSVALLEDLPGQGLLRGQMGTVVERWAPGVYEVEFCDRGGATLAMAAVKADRLLVLHDELIPQAA